MRESRYVRPEHEIRMTLEGPIPRRRKASDPRSGGPALHLVGAAGEAPGATDRDLVEGIVLGAKWAQDGVWHRYAAMINRFAFGALGCAQDARDVTQEVFLGLYARAGSIRQPDALKGFLFASALRQIHWQLRRRRVRRWVGLSASGEPPDLPVEGADFVARDALRRYYAILDTLSDRERSMFVLRHMEGFTLEEVAATARASLATVKRCLVKASANVAAAVAADAELSERLGSIEGRHET
jgi:RNA polymerase sigma-70 factor (ECF subfamily)